MSQPSKKTILIVDDTPANLKLLATLLTAQEYRVRPAPNGEHALASVQKEPPDLILLDIMMPEMDGYVVCRRLKADPKTQAIPVIFLSALNEVVDKVRAFSIGAVDFITKPFQVEEVLARVNTHLSLAELRRTLAAQNQELQEQNKELEAFAGTVAHDLKNPLAKISAALLVLQDMAPNLEADMQAMLTMSVDGAFKMSSIIDELLMLSSVRREKIQPAPVNMAQVTREAFKRLTVLVEQYQPEVTLPDTWPVAYGYAPWLEEVWANYLSNGLKYGGHPPRLELGATPQDSGQIKFWVQDNGPGLDRESQARLFTEFTRLDRAKGEGHGLGLSIVQRIVSKLGGRVGVESAPGLGSLFYFTLPGETPN